MLLSAMGNQLPVYVKSLVCVDGGGSLGILFGLNNIQCPAVLANFEIR